MQIKKKIGGYKFANFCNSCGKSFKSRNPANRIYDSIYSCPNCGSKEIEAQASTGKKFKFRSTVKTMEFKDFMTSLRFEIEHIEKPITGILEYQNKVLYFKLGDDGSQYEVWEVQYEDMEYLIQRHKCFVENVGSYCDFKNGVRNSISCFQPSKLWKNYFEKYDEPWKLHKLLVKRYVVNIKQKRTYGKK